jgi:hypothetical protein
MYSTFTDFIFLRKNTNPYIYSTLIFQVWNIIIPPNYKSLYVITNIGAATFLIQENKGNGIIIIKQNENIIVNIHKNIVEKAIELGVEYIYCQ